MNKIKIAFVYLMSLFFVFSIKAQSIQMPELAKEIRDMRDADQKLRKKWAKIAKAGKTETKKFKKLTDQLLATDIKNTERMKVIIIEYGWPTYDMIGKKAANNAWLLVQHADRDPLFQIKCLPMLKKAADEGQADLVTYAYLYDRVQIAKGDKQLYATQSTTNNGITKGYFQPIEDEANVQNRRAEMGFDLHVETYANNMGMDYKILSKEEAKEKAATFLESYNLHIAKAYQAMETQSYEEAITHFTEAIKSNGSVQTEDFIEAARAYSLAKHKKTARATFYLIRATIRGYENCNDFLTDNDFEYLKQESPDYWKLLVQTIKRMNE